MVTNLAKYIDYTALKGNTTLQDVEKMCSEAKEYGFATICIQPAFVSVCSQLLADSEVGVTTVVGFPFGANKLTSKAFEAGQALLDGATDIDMVLNIGALLEGRIDQVKQDINAVAEVVNGKGILKVILETAYLNEQQIVTACKASKEAGADFVKTSTGFAGAGATVEHIKLMRDTVGPDFGVKASGGISSYHVAMAMIEAGANRLGASSGIAIVQGSETDSNY